MHKNVDILFFSRGRGYGHAVPDIAIAELIRKKRQNTDILFASYGTGAKTFEAHGLRCIDLDLPEQNSLMDTLVKATGLLDAVRPSFVLSHEEFAVGPASAALKCKNAFITDWFGDERKLKMKALKFFDEILYIGDFGTFNIPSYLVDKISPIGPIIRPLKWSKNDRELARKELSIGTDKFVISVMPGGWATEAKSPIYTLALSAFELLLDQDIQVLWMAGNDFETVRTELALYPNIQVRPYDPVIERVMVASDIAITKANRVTVQELDFLGIPSISLSDRANSVGDLLISKISSVLQLVQAELTAQQLADHIKSAMVDEKIHQPNIRRHLGSKSLDTLTDRILERLP